MEIPRYLVYKATPLGEKADAFEVLTATERDRRAPFRLACRTSDGGGIFYLPVTPLLVENHRLYELGDRIETLEARAIGLATLKAVDFTDGILPAEEVDELVAAESVAVDQVA